MYKSFFVITCTIFFSFTNFFCIEGLESSIDLEEVVSLETVSQTVPFTATVNGDRVRLRAQHNLDALIIKEVDKGEYFLVLEEVEDFYRVAPPSNLYAYVFRTFVLDNKIEGTHVNIRVAPDLEAPVIMQVDTGEPLFDVATLDNKKWFRIAFPEKSGLFIHKDYLSHIGEESLYTTYIERKKEVQELLKEAALSTVLELEKPFEEIDKVHLEKDYQKVINDYSEFTKEIAEAKKALELIQEQFMQKKVAFLENLTEIHEASKLEEESEIITDQMKLWGSVEENLFENWALHSSENENMESFYMEEKNKAIVLKGFVNPYQRLVKNRPGDFLLCGNNTKPLAFLYSTKVDLQKFIGKKVEVLVIPRPNNNFAYPAYFVISTE